MERNNIKKIDTIYGQLVYVTDLNGHRRYLDLSEACVLSGLDDEYLLN